jgi:4-alpha-glucanotransferase
VALTAKPARATPGAAPPTLATLARLWDLQTSYRDAEGRLRHASREAVLALLAALGAPLDPARADRSAIAGAVAERERALWGEPLEPVLLAWDGQLRTVRLRQPAGHSGRVSFTLEHEDGETERLRPAAEREWVAGLDVGGQPFVELAVALERRLPLGYHRLRMESGKARAEALVIAAPRRAYAGPERMWGVFSPAYALHSDTDGSGLGFGDVGDLRTLLRWVESLGGSLVATLPLLPTFLDAALFEPSPYSPVSRRFWNEIYIDLAAVPEVTESPAARQALAEAEQALARAGALTSPLVDYRRVAAAKRRVLEAAAARLLEAGSDRQGALAAFAAAHPDLDRYAAFRAACERFGGPWQSWPGAARGGQLTEAEAPPAARHYHRYVQFVADAQIAGASESAGAALLFDLPLGGHPAGFDVWADQGLFLDGVTTGAPPDPLNANGQDWGNPPVHAERARATGYAYPLACIRHLLAYSGVLRIDHVMGLHRIFCLPQGFTGDGAYLRSHAEEFYALFCLESHRARGGRGAMIVGEDLGTVPSYIRSAMRAHGIYRSYVGEFAIRPGAAGSGALETPPAASFASLDTHDLPPFAAFWRGTDIDEGVEIGVITEQQAAQRSRERAAQREQLAGALAAAGLLPAAGSGAPPSEEEVLEAWLAWLAGSPARAVVITLDDLWGETGAQNLPGTVDEHPNWRRRAAKSIEAIRSTPTVVGRLTRINDARRQPGRAGGAAR